MKCIPKACLLCLLFSSCFFAQKKKEMYTIAGKGSWEGVELHGTGKAIQGFTNDLFFEIGRLEDTRIEVKTVETVGSVLSLLDTPGIDAVISVLAPSQQNVRVYEFSDPFFTFGSVFVVRADHPYESLDELNGKVIGFERGFGSGTSFRQDIHGIFRPYDRVTYGIEDLLAGKIDALILDSIYASQFASGIYAGKIKISPIRLANIDLRIVVKKGENTDLITLFNQGLKEVKEKGVYEKMLTYWGLFLPAGS